ncbi:unnamed protein product [Cercopithifilaria johnstoni]|uniref:Uncharacterized protein n=1 Tax=Cercopithifilaria johnstoni TaxID=2874296 RepID=A0A8J2M202_9BILA|nr:unnamed protein product [Cercopithifilaria johnstoni]
MPKCTDLHSWEQWASTSTFLQSLDAISCSKTFGTCDDFPQSLFHTEFERGIDMAFIIPMVFVAKCQDLLVFPPIAVPFNSGAFFDFIDLIELFDYS